MQELVQLTWGFSRSFSIPCASFSMFDPQLIESLIKNLKWRKLQTNKKETHTGKKFITQQFIQKIAKSFKKSEYNIAYTTNNTFKRHLTNKTMNNTKHEKHTSTGVYKLKCKDRPKYYIDQTGRSFRIRYTEHIKALTQPLIK